MSSKLVMFPIRLWKNPNAGPTPKHRCMVLDLAQHWSSLDELMRMADGWRAKLPNLTQASVSFSCHGEWYGEAVHKACTASYTFDLRLHRDGFAPIPADVAVRFGEFHKQLIEMDAEVVLSPLCHFRGGTFKFVLANDDVREAGWVIETKPVTYGLLEKFMGES